VKEILFGKGVCRDQSAEGIGQGNRIVENSEGIDIGFEFQSFHYAAYIFGKTGAQEEVFCGVSRFPWKGRDFNR
jgi:hypothetical protein